MKTRLDCLPCFVHHAVEVATRGTQDQQTRERVVREALKMATATDLDLPPPAMARRLHAMARDLTGVDDLYLYEKRESTRFALEILPRARRMVEDSSDPFEASVKMAIAGNLIDFGATRNFSLDGVEEKLHQAFAAYLDPKMVELLRDSMASAKRILYLLDNCGEIVFDRLLLELHKDKTIAAVRGGPIINDATIDDAKESGVAGLVPVVDTGDRSPGVLLEFCSKSFKEVFDECDLVISKGQGNLETLGELAGKKIIFLLKVKCQVVADDIGVKIGTPLILPNWIKQASRS